MKKIFFLVLLVACVFGVQAQKTKIGHINSEELMQIMPGRDTAQAALENEMKSLESTLKDMQTELENRYTDYMQRKDGFSELIRQTKEKELQDMNARVQEFQKNAEKQLQERQAELIKPIVDRLKQAINDVAKENGFSYVFDDQVLLYSEEADDITALVKKKLGIK